MAIGHVRRDGPRVVLGLVLLALGVLFTLDKLGYVNAGRFWEYWPIILIAVGLGRVIEPRGGHGRGFGVVLLVVGTWILLSNLDLIEYQVWDFWPLLLVLLGVSIVWRALAGPGRRGSRGVSAAWIAGDRGAGATPASGGPDPVTPGAAPDGGAGGAAAPTWERPFAGQDRSEPRPADAASTVSAFAMLGGVRRRSVSQDFRGGDLTAIMGGCELDLRQAAIAGGEAVLETFAFWGGIEIKVPQDWTVLVQGTPLLGSYDDKTLHAGGDGRQVLVVRGTAIMGGVEVKN
jgi:hypothetical protein